MRFCPKCGELYVDQLLAFCLADGAPLGVVKPDSDVWREGSRLLEQKQNALKTQQRKLKWRRLMLTTMLMATMAVSIASVSRSIYVTVEPARGQLCITTFNDLDGNGLQDASEPALSGFQVEVRGTDQAKTLTTDVNGSICSDLPVGTYTIIEQPRDGLIATTPTTQTVSLAADETARLLFGGRPVTGSIRIAKFDDLNHNGVQDPGEQGVSGIVLQVSGTDATTTLTTGPDGMASAVVPVGAYTVVEQPQDGTTPITQAVTVTEGHTEDVSFAIGKARGKLCIKTFDDSNDNRVRDAGEPGLSGFVFQVSATGAATLLTTDSDGTICSDMPVGKYTVVERPQGGWIATTPKTRTITVTADQTATALFGSKRQRGNLCIATFNDLNGDGVKDADEPSLPGFVFEVREADAAKTLPTDIKGIGCSDVAIGTYIVVAQPPGGWIATTSKTKTITVTADHPANVFFGGRQERGKLCITAFDDSNGNHERDASEPGLPGRVFKVSGTGAATTLPTDSQGGVCSEFSAGTYTVIEQPQRGWSATTDTKLTVTVTAGQKTKVVFGSRQEIKQQRGTLCIAAFDDLNGNHAHEADEPGLFGFVFQISGAEAATTLQTDRKGTACADLPLGTYTVMEIPKPGWKPTTATEMTVILTSNSTGPLFFGNRKPEPECLEADKSREWQLILHQYENKWRQNIEGERKEIIDENVPRDSKVKYEISLGPIKPQHVFRSCATVTVVLRYSWQIDFFAAGKKSISRERSYLCEKTAAGWICSK